MRKRELAANALNFSVGKLQVPLAEMRTNQKPEAEINTALAEKNIAPVTLEAVEKAHISETLKQTGGTIGGKGGAGKFSVCPFQLSDLG